MILLKCYECGKGFKTLEEIREHSNATHVTFENTRWMIEQIRAGRSD